ncbi:MAG: hypothetical protein RIF39_00790 [Cyclobacteriaceae bacterium]
MKTGIWIDLKKAVFVNLHKDKKELKTILSEIDPQERTPGESKVSVRFGNQFSNLEKQKENRLNNQTKEYLNLVTKELSHSDAFVIFGPAGMKHELEKLVLKNKDLSKKLQGVKTADSMTDNQIAAWVVDFFK